MEGYGNQQIGTKPRDRILHGRSQQLSQRAIEIDSSVIFEMMDGLPQSFLIDPGRTSPGKRWRSPQTGLAEMVGSVFSRIGEGAAGAARGDDRMNTGDASGADSDTPRLPTAQRTGRRQQQIQQIGKAPAHPMQI